MSDESVEKFKRELFVTELQNKIKDLAMQCGYNHVEFVSRDINQWDRVRIDYYLNDFLSSKHTCQGDDVTSALLQGYEVLRRDSEIVSKSNKEWFEANGKRWEHVVKLPSPMRPRHVGRGFLLTSRDLRFWIESAWECLDAISSPGSAGHLKQIVALAINRNGSDARSVCVDRAPYGTSRRLTVEFGNNAKLVFDLDEPVVCASAHGQIDWLWEYEAPVHELHPEVVKRICASSVQHENGPMPSLTGAYTDAENVKASDTKVNDGFMSEDFLSALAERFKQMSHTESWCKQGDVFGASRQSEDQELLEKFTYAHLPERLQAISKPFCELAKFVAETVPDKHDRTHALRKIMEAKDCAVRAVA